MGTSPQRARFSGLRERIVDLTIRDQRRLRRRLDGARKIRGPDALDEVLDKIEREISAAEQRVQARRARLPTVSYPAELPVSQRKDDLLAAIRDHQVVIVAGETGSGKTTQLPKICLELGRGVLGMIGHTQPRRLAARAVADRMAEELGTELGEVVGYQVRFSSHTTEHTLVKVMTDGILLAELSQDRHLEKYDTLIIDEAHERSLNIDFILGYLRQLLPRRPDLKVIITSATIDPDRFARHFASTLDGEGPQPAPVLEVSGRTYPMQVRYQPLDPPEPVTKARDPEERDQVQAISDAVSELTAEGPGDILIFLSGEREIRDTADALRGEAHPNTEILPLYARLSTAEQHRVFAPHPGRRIILATNVAETSLTVPGIRYVIDPGTARISRYSHRLKVQRLPIEPISQASANQRAGRCGRLEDGICIRLYGEDDYAARPAFTDPEILRTNLASVILQMAALDIGEIEDFPFIDPPDRRQVKDGIELLRELGAITPAVPQADARRSSGPESSGSEAAAGASSLVAVGSSAGRASPTGSIGRLKLTRLGRKLAELPIDPRLGRMVLAAADEGCVPEVLVIAAALAIQDPRERPTDAARAPAGGRSESGAAGAVEARSSEPEARGAGRSSEPAAGGAIGAGSSEPAAGGAMGGGSSERAARGAMGGGSSEPAAAGATEARSSEPASLGTARGPSSQPGGRPRRGPSRTRGPAEQAADQMHARFADPTSDFLAYLNLWRYLRERQKALSSNQFRKMCRAEYLHYLRVREWQDLEAQLRQAARAVGVAAGALPAEPDSVRVHSALLAGLLSHVGVYDPEKRDYTGARNAHFAISPGSVLFSRGSRSGRNPAAGGGSPRFVMAAELVETTRLWARVVARIEPEWIEPLAEHLVRRNYSEPHWERKQGAVIAYERVTLYGVPIVTQRKVNYGRIDPQLSRELFIRNALVEGDWETHHKFFHDNQDLLAEVEELEDRARRRDILVDDEVLFDFYDRRIGEDVVSARHFDAWWKKVRRNEPDLLTFDRQMLVAGSASEVTKADYPEVWPLPLTGDQNSSRAAAQPTPGSSGQHARQDPDRRDGDTPTTRRRGIQGGPKATRKDLHAARRERAASPAAHQSDHPDQLNRRAEKPTPLRVTYQFEPGAEADGVTVHIPLPALEHVRHERFDWQVPGLREELVTALIRSLPKALRRSFVPIPDHARAALAGTSPADGPLLDVLADRLSRTAGVRVPPDAFDIDRVPAYLKMTYRVEDEDGRVLAEGKDLDRLREEVRPATRANLSAVAGGLERHGLRTWEVGTLPTVVGDRREGYEVRAYPALVDEGASVGVKLFDTPDEQAAAMWAGTRRLLLLDTPAPIAHISSRLSNAAKLILARNPHGGVGALLGDCSGAALDLMIAESGGPPWDEASFVRLREQVRAELNTSVLAVVGRVQPILAAVQHIEQRLPESPPGLLADSLADIRAHLSRLVYPGFVTATGYRRLPDIVRYLQAIGYRLDKLPANPTRDRDLTVRVQEVEREYDEVVAALPSGARLHDDVVAARWMLEELRISYFAQAQRTAFPVSEKRIARALDDLEAKYAAGVGTPATTAATTGNEVTR
jgi:HrpA-like RNA helicase